MTVDWGVTLASTLVGGLAGGGIAWIGNYHVQHRLHRRVERIEELRRLLYEYLRLASDYWHGANDEPVERRMKEGRLLVAQTVIGMEYSLLAEADRRMNASYVATEEARFRLFDAGTGGCFQQEAWKADTDRVKDAAKAVADIVQTFR